MQEFINSLIATITSFIGVGVALAGYRITTKEKREKKIADQALLVESVKQLKETTSNLSIEFKKEYGGNSGGLREKLNNHAKLMEGEAREIKASLKDEAIKSEAIATIVHRLEGAFEEHRLTHERSG